MFGGVRRTAYLEVSESLSVVCTISCVRTILRDNGQPFKMGLPEAYGANASANLYSPLNTCKA